MTGYTISSCLLLLVSLSILYNAVIRHIDEEDSRFLIDKLHLVRAVLAMENVSLDDVLNDGIPAEDVEYSIHVIDAESGELIVERSGANTFPPASAFPEPVPGGGFPAGGTKYYSPTGQQFLLVTALVEQNMAPRRLVEVQIAQNRSDDTAFTRRFQQLLVAVLLGGVLAAVVVSWLTARHGLRPLEEMGDAVAGIGASRLHRRLSAGPWPAELISLVSAFDEMLSRLEESFDRLSQFSADLAHELRTPIQNLRGEAEVALTRPRTAEEYREVIEMSIEECEGMARMIDSLLFLARAENDEMRIDRKWLDVGGEIDKILDFYEAAGSEAGVVLSRSGNGRVEADPVLLGRAISNLVSNALSYTGPGGRVAISVGERGEIEVSDSGAGIAPEHLDRIFDRFYRVEASRTSDPAGTGLGLAIVKSIVDLHGGSVVVESETGRGTSIILRFSDSTATASSPPQ